MVVTISEEVVLEVKEVAIMRRPSRKMVLLTLLRLILPQRRFF
jgi:hypothetical protein